MIDQLITALSKEVEMSAVEIADTLWLALQMQEFQAESVSSGLPLNKEDERGINKQESQSEQGILPNISDLEKTQTQPPEEQKAGIYPRNQQHTSKSLDLSFKVPDAPSLREPLTLARGLKPLMRRVPSGRELVLDEAATIQRIADEGLWIPVIKPTVEPWLDLELVVDEAISMQIWRHTIKELERLLKNYGIFRDVRVWGLITDENEQVQIRRGIGATAKNQTTRSPKELIDPSGRRLVLVVSDCVSSLWRNGAVTPVLELWAKQGSMAIVQMLPKWLWKRTALGRASEVRLRGLTPGMSNHKLIAKEVSLWDELEEEKGVKVPVFTLEADKVVTWAQMLSGKGGIWTLGYVFKLDATPVNKDNGLFNLAHSDLSAEERVQAFRVTASPMARKLAGLLASAPVISLPIVRLIREAMLKDSQQVHVAEVFLGGLLKSLSEINADTNPDYVQYDFMDGVRELLVDSVPSQYVLNVVDEISKYVARKAGLSLEDFATVLRNPQQFKDSGIVEEVGYFATVTAQVLRRLGGEYAKWADEINTQLLEEDTKVLYEARLFIIGEGGVGKTSLANKLIDSKYKLKLEGGDNPEKSTEGIDVLHLDFPNFSGNPFRMNIWDFGGQEIYHATHQFFFTKRSLYLLVADTRQDNTDFNYWLEVVELLSEASPVIIVKNEKQDRPCQVNENQLRGRFPNIKKILSTNLASNRGLSEILTAVQHHISQLPHIGTLLPKTWVRVREALEADNRNHITQDEFFTLCDTHGFKRREDKLQLSGYLHDLGVCLHFQEDPILKNWVILKPEWVTTAVYTVLDTPEVQKALGCFTHKDLAKIWADDQYSDMRDELLQLMMRFKLCYEIPHRPRTYIAPQLLSPNQPKYDWDDRENLILRYYYDFMPKGMLTRFIVEMHKPIDNELIWKDGVILTDGNARAEVIEAYYKNEIRIRVSGFPKKDLLTRIRHEFNKIHDSYEKLRYQELIPCNCPTCKGSQNPHAYALKKLQERIQNQNHEIECDKPPYHKVNVHSLIDDAIGHIQISQATENDQREEYYSREAYEDMQEITKLAVSREITLKQEQAMTNEKNQTWTGDRVDGDKVMGDKDTIAGNKMKTGDVAGDAIAGNKIVNSQNLAQAAKDIKDLLDQISATDRSNKPTIIAVKAIEAIEKNPTLKDRIINAGKEAGFAALDAAVDHPSVKIVTAAIKGAMEA
ncbi:SAV_2336 N-terminal domain-related protein [Calothrix sp. PCC 6303]|uniref:SAV_2336 N-terminal domain-related protein n=1 Tax=Calothrix sp. PCC 6303 TaxID=1170562 RepID=UPI0002A029D0|nr:SAV_2336 N-terminal domain-related protein [Calothrix sp. PCC 6303]AFZ01290.1 Miro domain protein [Calothrix sp. PCC 6303]